MSLELTLRVVNAAGCVLALWILADGARRQRGTWNVKTQDHWLALFGWVFLGFIGAIEAISRGLAVGPTSVGKLLVVAITLRAILRSGNVAATRPQVPWKKDKE